jgi:hypothetical protein
MTSRHSQALNKVSLSTRANLLSYHMIDDLSKRNSGVNPNDILTVAPERDSRLLRNDEHFSELQCVGSMHT